MLNNARAPRQPASDAAADYTARDVVPRPFVKWAGGKRQLLPQLLRYVPERFGAYHEPFVGGGALFFQLFRMGRLDADAGVHLSDDNRRLVRTFWGLQDGVERVIDLLRACKHDKEAFLRERERDIDACSDAQTAAWLIYLNRTGYNGLYRVNSANKFNVPFGRYENPRICDEENLRGCSQALRGVQIHCEDFAAVLERARRGDFVYFDPPYMPLSKSSSFTAYTDGGFGLEQHERLRDVALGLKRKGAHVLLSSSCAPEVEKLYAQGFELIPVEATRSVNSKADGRGKITEYVIR